MILFLIFGALFLISIVSIIIGNNIETKNDTDCMLYYGGHVVGTIILVILVICSLLIINVNTPWDRYEIRESLQVEIDSLNCDYNTFMKNGEGEIISTQNLTVTEYNEKVKDFKEDLIYYKAGRMDPFTNWFVSSVYDEFTGDEVKYLGEE